MEGVHDAVLAHRPVSKIQRRSLAPVSRQALDAGLRKSWGALRRAHREVEDPQSYDEEANAWLPIQSYYAVYHSVLSFAVASGQAVPRDHAAALKLVGKEACRGRLPYPWSVSCTGCPQTGSHSFGGLLQPEPFTSSAVPILGRVRTGLRCSCARRV